MLLNILVETVILFFWIQNFFDEKNVQKIKFYLK